MREQAVDIDIQPIQKITDDFVKNTKCPYGTLVSYLNRVNGYMTPDRGNKIRGLIKHLLLNNFNRANAAGYIDKFLDEENLHFKSASKYKAHVYEILYLQEWLYDLIHNYLTTTETPELIHLKNATPTLDLDDSSLRHLRGRKFKTILKDSWDGRIENRVTEKKRLEPEMQIVEESSRNHTNHNKNSVFGFIDLIKQGIGDGIDNCWDVVQNIPDLYRSKYGTRISTSEYRRLVALNMKTIFTQVSTLNLAHLTNILRNPYGHSFLHVDDWLTLNEHDFALNDKWIIEGKRLYMIKIIRRMQQYIGQYMFSLHVTWKTEHEEQVRLGCPAMTARTQEGKRITDQFIDDILQLLDEVYFPYRER